MFQCFFLAGLALLFAPGANAVACDANLRSIQFDDIPLGPVSEDSLLTMFAPYWYLHRTEKASIVDVGGTNYLDIELDNGCYGNSAENGCGMYGMVPINDMSFVEQATLEFTIRFDENFEWNKGGKLPGLCGTNCPTGCARPTSSDGFSARVMWAGEGNMMLYTYSADMDTTKCGEESFPESPLNLQPGQDYKVRMVVVLNTPGEANGKVQLFVGGRLQVERSNMRMRGSATQGIDYMILHNFFGGNDPSWAAPRTSHIMYSSIKVMNGNCGSHFGQFLPMIEADDWIPKPRSEDTEYPLDVQVELANSWPQGFCITYTIDNNTDRKCDSWELEANINPRIAEISEEKMPDKMSFHRTDREAGSFVLRRSPSAVQHINPMHYKTGNVCAVTKLDGRLSAETIMTGIDFNAACLSATP